MKCQLLAANLTPINVFCIQRRTVEFALGKPFHWEFLTADMPYPILGGDALAHLHLLPDLTERTLVDSSGQVYGRCDFVEISHSSVSLVNQNQTFSTI